MEPWVFIITKEGVEEARIEVIEEPTFVYLVCY